MALRKSPLLKGGEDPQRVVRSERGIGFFFSPSHSSYGFRGKETKIFSADCCQLATVWVAGQEVHSRVT